MTTARTTSATRALAAFATSVFALSLVALAVQATALATSANTGCTGAYGWPVRPFDTAHPVRANFGDPRTRFSGANSPETLLDGDGTFSFHQGVDISAPDGAPVYAVASGTIVRARGGRVTVDCGNGRSFQYWHVNPVARVGQHAIAGETLLGFVQPKREHVHLTHLEKGVAVNPLAPGHLTPYRDTTTPEVLGLAVDDDRGQAADPNGVSGRVYLIAEAIDNPGLPVPGRWNGFPVTPALVMWRIERAGRVVLPMRVARDVRRSVPKNNRFWETFARGTHQNWPIFDGHKYQFQPGRYLFKLSPQPLDTHRLRDGTYQLVVVAEDTAGNRDVRRLQFMVRNYETR